MCVSPSPRPDPDPDPDPRQPWLGDGLKDHGPAPARGSRERRSGVLASGHRRRPQPANLSRVMSHSSGVPRASMMMQACLESRTSVSASSGQAPNRRQTRPGRRSPHLVARSNHAPAPGCAQQSPASRASSVERVGLTRLARVASIDDRNQGGRVSTLPPPRQTGVQPLDDPLVLPIRDWRSPRPARL
jgi:hypothetical protein